MRILKINSVLADIDEATAIGINFQNYDINDPANRKFSFSNSFTIPLTSKNNMIIGFASDVQSFGSEIYDKLSIEYWNDNEKLIDGKCEIQEISNGRIKLTIFQKDSFYDELKLYKYTDFVGDFIEWLQDEKGYPSLASPYFGSFQSFINNYINTTEGLILPYLFSNFFMFPISETEFKEDEDNLWLFSAGYGGHFCAYVKTIFEFLEYKFNIDFQTGSSDESLIWNDEYGSKAYIHMRGIALGKEGLGDVDYYFKKVDGLTTYPPYNDAVDIPDKTMYDFFKSFIQTFHLVVLENRNLSLLTISLKRFDDIIKFGEVVLFTNKLDLKKTVFKPAFSGICQNNRIKYGTVYPDAPESEGERNIVCNNKNLESEKTLFTLDAYYPNFVKNSDDEYVINLSTEESLETFIFMVSSGITYATKNVNFDIRTFNGKLQIAQLYDISGEYLLFDSIFQYPKYYEVYAWLTINDIINLDFYKLYYFKELRGAFYINKISGFNPEKSKAPTKIEIVRVSDKTPYPISDFISEIYVDGLLNPFVDGSGNYYI